MATTISAPRTYLRRLIGSAALDASVYEEIEADRSAGVQALATVLLSSVAAGIGALGFGGASAVDTVAFVTTVSVLGWVAWALVTFEVGVRVLPQPQTRSDPGELLRTIGFSTSPGLIRALGIFPGATVPAFAVSTVWMLAAMILAVRQSLDYQGTWRAVLVCIVGWVLAVAIALGLGLIFGPAVQ